MSKIDEFIKDYSDHPISAESDWLRAKSRGEPTSRLMVVTVEDLDQLRPYVELGEKVVMHSIDHELMNSPEGDEIYMRQGDEWFNLLKRHNENRTRIDELINQIKEQKNV